MSTKWKIRRYSKTWRDDSPVWVATAPDVRLVQEKVWVNIFLPSDRYKYFDTFAEAIAWATRKTRTVEVELPTVNPDQSIQGDYVGSFPLRVRRNWYGGTSLSIPGARTFAITPEEREKLALYLLAEHYHHERNQK